MGLGPVLTVAFLTQGEGVRQAFLLTDTFAQVDVGQALLANRDIIKENVRGQREGNAQQSGGLDDRQLLVLDYLDGMAEWHQLGDKNREYIQASEISDATGIPVTSVGLVVRRLFPGIQNVQRKGYPMGYIQAGMLDYLKDEEEVA